ncbi:tubulin--tyrosine ligase, putative [Plasmodium sp. gorilla clade G2]|uniref:tubulin--tyrosine ligase, putative n=1 Tax=Plasmodium sp. gorilla clade G2 TaxID=880535 RepID=UPI000D20B2D0|nr:tubulin--tyrosine ligase, putative [Plasmodium sp. gorilla clade G2]SOV14699.1 tubulin--tyrosine ligase, putative [Plasmodium sp. gorilla clade G2]
MDDNLLESDDNKCEGHLKNKKGPYKIYLHNTRYDIIRKVVNDSEDWMEAGINCKEWDVMWIDTSICEERFRKLKKFQKINHFIGMRGITRKDELSKHLKKMKKYFPQCYNFFPMTWILPNELSDFKNYFKKKGSSKTYIVKLKNSCQGKGIYLTQNLDNINKYESCIIQKYIHKPLLINGLKFDIRLYVLITGSDPLRIFLHEEGLVRLSIEKYKLPKNKNLKHINMHLTNFSINKMSDKFEYSINPDDATIGHKRSWKVFLQRLKQEGLPMDSIMKKIEHLIVKTISSIQPELNHYYNSAHYSDYSNSMCFEILGFDILLDYKLKPWLLEVNHSPSFSVYSKVDHKVKYAVIKDTLNILYMQSKYRQIYIQEYLNLQKFRKLYNDLLIQHKNELKKKLTISRFHYENNNLGGYKRLYPLQDLLEYQNLILFVSNAWNKSIGIPYTLKPQSYDYLFQKDMTKQKISNDSFHKKNQNYIEDYNITMLTKKKNIHSITDTLKNMNTMNIIKKYDSSHTRLKNNLNYNNVYVNTSNVNISNCSTSC